MTEISILLTCLHGILDQTTIKQLMLLSECQLTMAGRITMLGMSRWTEKGGSYRTIQRFFQKNIIWSLLHWELVKPKIKESSGVILIAGDATTVTKSGKHTYGLGRFFSSIYSRAVPGIAFQCLSLIDVATQTSYPLVMEQIISENKGKAKRAKKKSSSKRGRGRPKGSKNKNHREVELNAEMTQVQFMLCRLLELIAGTISPVYFVYDGAFGNNAAVQMVNKVKLQLISKLRCNSRLYFELTEEYSGKGRPKTYGDRVDYNNIPCKHRISEVTEDGIYTHIYQFKARNHTFADSLNVVVIMKDNIKTGKQARVILFSTDLKLAGQDIIEYYHLRFQIEFNFRDAKQHWGLEDFMVIKEQAVSNSANLSMWMVNLSQVLLSASPENSILDLKARYHGLRYVREVFKILPKKADSIKINQLISQIPILGKIHEPKVA
jgi:putative transposase